MAGETGPRGETFRWWFLPSWLGLDAPCVVLTWTWAIGRNFEIAPSFRPAAAMFLFVWSIYLLDRMIDVARCSDWQRATGRLHFGRRHRSLFLACLSFCAIGLVVLLSIGLPADLIRRATYVALGLTAHFLAFIVPVFRRDVTPLRAFAADISAPFEREPLIAFADWYRAASTRGCRLLCVFEDTGMYRNLVRELQLGNLDYGLLGDRYEELSVVSEAGTNHC